MARVARGSGDHDPLRRRPAAPSETPGAFVGIALQIARKFLFIDAQSLAAFLMAEVLFLSIVSSWVSYPEETYIVQKHSIFNQWGVKLGWFWTCVVVGPFIWFASKAHYKDKDRWLIDILRLVVSTGIWYFTVGIFHRILAATSRCDIDAKLSRSQCSEQHGHWIPGIDLSGHCFLMIYSLLIMSEEANAFRAWHVLSDEAGQNREQFVKNTKIVQGFFIGMLVLSALWMKQLVISVLYYHIWYDKVFGALVAVACWFVTYRILYPVGILQPPINRAVQISVKRR